MKCESIFCIYQQDDACILPDTLSFNRRGMCDCYCPINLDPKILQKEKRILLVDYETPAFMQEYDAKYKE